MHRGASMGSRAYDILHSNSWCKICLGLKNTPLKLQKKLQKEGGLCLSHEYRNNKSKLRWQCSEGHQWDQTLHQIKNGGSWCPKCAGNIPLALKT